MRIAIDLFNPSFIILLITSQTYSLIASIGLPYVANDKIAFLLVVIFLFAHRLSLTYREKILLLVSFAISALLLIFLLLRYFYFGVFVNTSSINHILAILETILFAIYYRNFSVAVLWRSLLICLSIHLIIASIQVAFAFNGFSELTAIFSNYPPRSDYRLYAEEGLTGAVIGLPRAYGLFHEASGLSVLVGLVSLLCSLTNLRKFLPDNKIYSSMVSYIKTNCLLLAYGVFLSILGVTLTFSLTGLLYTFFPLIILTLSYSIKYVILNYKLSSPLFLLVAAIVLIPVVFNRQSVGFLVDTFTSSSRYFVTSEYLSSIPNLPDDEFFFGKAMTWEGATWDYLTRTFQVWGLIGSFLNYTWYLIILLPLNSPFSLAAFAASLSNGSLAASASLLMLSFAIYLNFPIVPTVKHPSN
ncbi:hypothetical protein [Synechococcus sp. CBW1107]|uniref:hypothetical protein n=1 Tax=Synechococcus sp. CBW1107 TaxID=2789857 RepID=UPI002AD1D6C6|nr:hypothetical protein [Synechococcus sp. CBW1107]CAK6687503.1 hypothetical protein MNNICLKF_00230 [Synechococcus sp. CBW1107]